MKAASLLSGIVILILSSFLVVGGGNAFAVHMVAHMAIVAVAAPLVALGIDRTGLDITVRLTWLTPLTASLIELVVVVFWHLPQIRALADQSLAVALVEQASFLAAGLLLWLRCLSAAPLAGAAGLLFTSLHMTLIGVLLALAPRPLYGAGEAICFGLPVSAATDQQVGGVVMLLVGALSYLAGGVALLYRLIAGPAGNTEPAP